MNSARSWRPRRITSGDFDSWYEAWKDAERVTKEAADQLGHGHHISARNGFLRAATYYRASEFFLHANPRDPRIASAYQRSVNCYKSCAKLSIRLSRRWRFLTKEPRCPDTTIAWIARLRNDPRSSCIPGFDGSAEEMHVDGARAAVERGYNVLTFDGPGQFGPLHREGLIFRPAGKRS